MLLKAGYNRYILLCIILKLKNDVRLDSNEFRRSITKKINIFFIYLIYLNDNLYFKYL